MKRLAILLGVLLYQVVPGDARAAQNLTFNFTGRVESITDATGFLGNTFHVGDPLFGRMIYDASVVDADPREEFGSYRQESAPSTISFTVNGFTFQAGHPIALTIRNNTISPVDNFIYVSNAINVPPQFNMGGSGAVDFQLADNTGTANSSDALPTNLFLDDWTNSATVEVIGSSPNSQSHYRIVGTIEMLSLVPEPSNLLIVSHLIATTLFVYRARRQGSIFSTYKA